MQKKNESLEVYSNPFTYSARLLDSERNKNCISFKMITLMFFLNDQSLGRKLFWFFVCNKMVKTPIFAILYAQN